MAFSLRRAFRFRLLPITIAAIIAMLGLRAFETAHTGRAMMFNLLSPSAQAEGDVGKTGGVVEPAKDKPKEKTEEASKASEEKKTEDAPAKEKDSAAAKEGEHGKGEKKDTAEDAPKRPNDILAARPQYSQVELDLLQSLSKRREEIEKWAGDVQMKQTLLDATEQRIQDKLEQLKSMKTQIDGLLAQYNELEDAKIRSLVKIYENMKPGDAARIFEEMEMPILLLVIDKMSERKAAPVLAAMTPVKAKEVTIQLAEQRRVRPQAVADAALNAANKGEPISKVGNPAQERKIP